MAGVMADTVRRRAICAGLLAQAIASILPGRPARAAMRRPALLLYQANLSARTPALLANTAWIDRLPFDGIAINIPASWAVMQPGARLAYEEVFGAWLAPLRGRFANVTQNLVLAVVRKPADPFDDWSGTIANWRELARAARDAGLVGVLFDNEPYFEPLWRWPQDLDSSRPLAAYQRQYRLRGRELMQAVCRVWPEVQFVVLHGPYLSEPRTPPAVTRLQAEADDTDLSGHFFVGLLEGAGSAARLVDGGEVYQYRTAQDFAASYAFRKHGIARLSPPGLIPEALRGTWAQRVSVGFGLYDRAWKQGYPMDPTILRQTLANALARADDYVWLFTESDGSHDYLVPDGVDAVWLDAIRKGRALAVRM